MLKKSGAIQLATTGKMAGCWIMPWKQEGKEEKELRKRNEQAEGDENMQDKIIVRSNGTVTYVGKEHRVPAVGNFGLLGKDFPLPEVAECAGGAHSLGNDERRGQSRAPHFGEPAATVYNVIDARQAICRKSLRWDCRAWARQRGGAVDSLVIRNCALTPRCAAEMGYEDFHTGGGQEALCGSERAARDLA